MSQEEEVEMGQRRQQHGAPAALATEASVSLQADASATQNLDATNTNEPDVASPYGGSPGKGEKSLEVTHEFDDSLHYMGVDQKRLFEMVERKSIKILNDDFGGIQGFAQKVEVDIHQGLPNTPEEETRRIEQCGKNELKLKEDPSFWEFLAEACADKIVIILAVAAVVSIVLGMTVPNPHSGEVELSHGWIEGTAIIIAILVVTLTGSINNYQKALQFQEMESKADIKKLFCKRGGEKTTVTSDRVVVGDLLYLEYGMKMSCDGLIIQASGLKMDESAITGESDQITKDPHAEGERAGEHIIVLSGTQVDEGEGLMLVTAVGMQAFQGHLKASLDDPNEKPTPMQEHLSDLADMIGIFGFTIAGILIAGLMIKEGILVSEFGKELHGANFLNFFLIAVTLIVVAIPEGLPLAVTIALAFAMKAMMNDECMVRVLSSCETMGAATAICSDKTGTLTTNVMTCVQGCIGGEEFMMSGLGLQERHGGVHVTDQKDFKTRTNPDVQQLFCTSVALNSTADTEVRDGKELWIGNKTEIGMLKLLANMEFDYKAIREQFPVTADNHHIKRYPFNSEKKRMTTIVREKDNTHTLHVKGASEVVLADCDFYIDSTGQTCVITDDVRGIFNDVIEHMAAQGNRTIGVGCIQELQMPADGNPPEEAPEPPLVFLGVMGIMDPIREEVPHAIKRCHAAGVRVRMCTGDNITTAISIAKKCGLHDDKDEWDIALLGQDFRVMYENDIETLKQLVPRLAVLARCAPNDKLKLVELLQKQGEVVGVTGDGTNDAPALKLADVGFAMNTGTDIAKGASDMVLMDDNFATVVTAIKWGRAVNDNVKKFLQFQLTINASGVFLTLIVSLVSSTSKEPFTPVQMLWLNLIMDTLAALSLATELPEESSLDRDPVYKEGDLITKRMWSFIAVHGIWQFVLIFVLLFTGHNWFNFVESPDTCDKYYAPLATFENGTVIKHPTRISCDKECTDEGGILDGYRCQQGATHSTFLFNIFIWTQIFNVINSRKIYGEMNPFEGLWDRSKQLIVIFIIIMGLQAMAVELFATFMSTVPLSGANWGISIGLSAITMLIGVVQRFISAAVVDNIPEGVVEKNKRIEELRDAVAKATHEMDAGAAEKVQIIGRAADPNEGGAARAAGAAAAAGHDAVPHGGERGVAVAGSGQQISNHSR